MKAALTVSLIAASLAGCAGTQTTSTSRTEPIVHQMPYKAGIGVVQSWAAVPSPAAGASGRVDPSGSGLLRLGIRMDDGSVQYVDTDSRDFPIGTRVELTPNKEIRRPGAPG